MYVCQFFLFQAEDGIRDLVRSRGLGDVYKRQAYTYAYASMGEFIAWIIGWDLIVEYAIGNIAVALSLIHI